VISGLVAEHEDGDRLTDTEIVTMILTLVLAGHETTAHLISNGTLALLRHPDQLDLLRRDPSLWPRAVHELMRFCGPVHITRLRYATEDVELGGVTIHAGDAVQAVLVSANFDPAPTPTRNGSTSPATRPSGATDTSVSATARITAWAPRWPGRRARWRCGHWSSGSRAWPWTAPSPSGCRCRARTG
jgi:Cytochrome P450